MQSQWFRLKEKAVALRRKGHSIKDVEDKLGIARSTLSGWFRDVSLTKTQRFLLDKRWRQGLVKARKNAIIWHNRQKSKRLELAKLDAGKILKNLDTNDLDMIELALAILYLGEGFKKGDTTGMGNSDPLLLKFFLKILLGINGLNLEKIRFDLHLRFDQDPKEIKKFWSKELGVPISKFKHIAVDKRTIGKPTYKEYKGVCVIDCGNVAIQRKLVYLGRAFCNNVVNNGRLAQLARART